jgi:uncharacterized protein YecE (DUF72 family)
MRAAGKAWIGCSGYAYDDWRGRFYPPELPQRRWFDHSAGVFTTVEINNTFYRLPAASTVDRWADRAPTGFRYALKLSRYGTHMKRLKEPEGWLSTFLAGAERLRSFLGPVLVQLPPNWRADPDRLDAFLAVAPRRHRWAIEVRDPRWLTDPVYEVLRHRGAALVVHDLLADHPREVTADFVYLRFHGPDPDRPYTGSYAERVLRAAARRIRQDLEDGRDVYAYFNNDVGACAVDDARTLERLVTG